MVLRRKKLWIGMGIGLIVLIGLGYYGNSQVNRMIDKLVSSGLVQVEGSSFDGGAESKGSPNSPNTVTGNANNSFDDALTPGINAPGDAASTGSSVSQGSTSVGSSGEIVMTPEQKRMVNGAENRLGRRIDRRDLLAVGNIMIQRFSWGEINYLYKVGSSAGAFHLSNEAHNVRNLLLSRLGPGEISTLTSIGNKYGLRVRILDPNWDLDQKRWIN